MRHIQEKYLNAIKIFCIFFLIALAASSVSGGVSSVDNISFTSNNDFFDENVFVLDFTGNDQTDSVNVFVDSEKLDSSISNGSVSQDIEIDATHTTTRAEYSFQDTDKPSINKVEGISFFVNTYADHNRRELVSFLNNSSLIEERCMDLNRDGKITADSDFAFNPNIFRDWNFESQVYCYSKGRQLASVGEIDSGPSAVFSTNFTVTSGERTVRKTVTNGDAGSGLSTRMSEDVHIQWQGNMGTGRNSPIPTDELISHSNSKGWKVIDRNNYRNYAEELRQSHLGLEDWKNGATSEQGVENRVNRAADMAYSNHDSTEFENANFNGSSISNGKMSIDIDNLRYPKFSIYITACSSDKDCDSFIQIERNTGSPEITKVSSTKIPELDAGTIQASFKNKGKSEGSFSSRISSCTQGFSPIGVTETVSLKPNESYNANLEVGFSSQNQSQKEISGSCTVEVKEQNSDVSTKENISIKGVQQNECIESRVFVAEIDGNDQIRKCSSNGLSSKVIEICKSFENAVISQSGYTCEQEKASSLQNSNNIVDTIGSLFSKINSLQTLNTPDAPNLGLLERLSNALESLDNILSSILKITESLKEIVSDKRILGITGLLIGSYFILGKS